MTSEEVWFYTVQDALRLGSTVEEAVGRADLVANYFDNRYTTTTTVSHTADIHQEELKRRILKASKDAEEMMREHRSKAFSGSRVPARFHHKEDSGV